MIESNIIGQGSVKGVMSGKHYNRSMYCHKIVSEALNRLRFKAFLDCLDDEDKNDVSTFISSLLDEFPTGSFSETVKENTFKEIMATYDNFICEASAENPTFAFWSNYLEMVEVLLCFIRYSTRV